MHPTVRLATAATPRVHKPLIHFVGKRVWPTTPRPVAPEPQHPHPAAPADYKEHFSDFVAKFKSSGSSLQNTSPSSAPAKSGAKESVKVFDDFWQVPARLRSPELSEAEMEAITVRIVTLKD
ncbi:hypothetical protein PHLCEN_2v11265 [Hermanssonia centrifuga]|uniref:Uncharacterized protein n=1 Tax=Hermanssonia centrifuga TaxID=98765 RepID=A0A2R6NKX7_9APHY|nr:hypothetical protein PHLCEN_2v11265 [Hermanssonia centrifuga]